MFAHQARQAAGRAGGLSSARSVRRSAADARSAGCFPVWHVLQVAAAAPKKNGGIILVCNIGGSLDKTGEC